MFRILLFVVLLMATFAGFLFLIKRMGARAQAGKYLRAFGILAILFLLVFLPMLLFSQVISVWEIFKFGVESFVASAGVPIWLARGIIALLIVPFLWALGRAFSFKRQARTRGMLVVAVYVAAYCFAMFQVQSNVYFRHDTGEATKWYCPEDLREFDTDGYDPACGTKLLPVTGDVARLLAAKREASPPVLTGREYFNPQTGEPLKWYHQAADGSYELFDQPGFHPRYRVALAPITPQVVKALEESERRVKVVRTRIAQEVAQSSAREQAAEDAAAYRTRYRQAGGTRGAGRPTLILEIGTSLDASGSSVEASFTDRIAQALEGQGFAVRADVIKEPAYADGILGRLGSGDVALLGRLDLRASADYLLLCSRTLEWTEYRQLRGQVSCVCQLGYKVIDTSNGRVHSGSVRGTNLGATKEEAAILAAEPVGNELAKALRASLGG